MSPEKEDLLKQLEELGHDREKLKRLSVTKLLKKLDESTNEEAFELDQLLTQCRKVKLNAIKKRHMAKARFATLLELTLISPRPACSHAMQVHFNSIMPRPAMQNFNRDVFQLFEAFKDYLK